MSLDSDRDEYPVGDMAPLYVAAAQAAADAGVRIALGTRYDGRRDADFLLAGRDGPSRVRVRFVVGADGARSRVACDLGLDRNRHCHCWSVPRKFPVPPGQEPPTFHCVLDPSLAPGYLAWVVNDGRHAHVGVAGYVHRFPDGMRRALDAFGASTPGLPAGRPDEVEKRGGPIPVGVCCAGSAARTGCSWVMRPVPSHRSRPVVSIRACGCRNSPPTSSTTPSALGGRRPWPTTTALRCARTSAADCCCAEVWPRCGRPPPRRRPFTCYAVRLARPPPAASSSATGPSPPRVSLVAS